jgi:2-polyprenyl-3-methyl-5-hydroxy-6-metoxy-1,4-benzoquinol methylase/spore coat polysaccharide biosynthesis predicted glycosyltransferase SpsG
MAEKESKAVESAAKTTEDGKILFIPAVGQGQGIGHLKRCAALVNRLKDKAWLYLPQKELLPKALVSSLPEQNILDKLPASHRIRLIVTDLRHTGKDLFLEYSERAVLIGLDEGGSVRALFPYLIDTFPLLRKESLPNAVFPYSSAVVKKRQKKIRFPIKRVLLSFGGEDPAGLTKILVHALLKFELFKPSEMTVVQGPLFRHEQWPEGLGVHKHVHNIEKLIKTHDLVITHFGLTCHEALAQGVPVIVFNPTVYHQKLTKNAVLPDIGIKNPKLKKLAKLLKDQELLQRIVDEYSSTLRGAQKSLSDFLLECKPCGSVLCPLCKKNQNMVVARFREKTYFRCTRCGMIYLLFCGSKPVDYAKSYFFEDYKKQYGRTYLEDFAFIQKLGRKRLNRILKILKIHNHVKLLDIGCAYGPFLTAAFQEGLETSGIDISEHSVRYVREQLGLNCSVLDIERAGRQFMQKNEARYDIVSMWFVIEHLTHLHKVLTIINRLLKKGGVFSFSTPSAAGISARKSLHRFLDKSPADHFTVWSPRHVKKQLALFGFSVKKIRITGHHVERFLPGTGRHVWLTKILSPVILLLSRLLNLGDTFEVYAIKESEGHE